MRLQRQHPDGASPAIFGSKDPLWWRLRGKWSRDEERCMQIGSDLKSMRISMIFMICWTLKVCGFIFASWNRFRNDISPMWNKKDIFRSFVSPQKTNMTMDKSQATVLSLCNITCYNNGGIFPASHLSFPGFFSPKWKPLWPKNIILHCRPRSPRNFEGTVRHSTSLGSRGRRVGCGWDGLGWVRLVLKIQHASHRNV